jgi:hypothetical protein
MFSVLCYRFSVLCSLPHPPPFSGLYMEHFFPCPMCSALCVLLFVLFSCGVM